MQPLSGNYISQNHQKIIGFLRAELATFGNVREDEDNPLTYNPEDKQMIGSFNDGYMTLNYSDENVLTENDFWDALNLDLTSIFWATMPTNEKVPFTNCRIDFGHTSLQEIEIEVWLQGFDRAKLRIRDPKTTTADKKVYDFATGKLNVGLIEKLFVEKLQQQQAAGEIVTIPVHLLEHCNAPHKIKQMPFIDPTKMI